MKKIAVIGAKGFVGSAFVRLLMGKKECELFEITRDNYEKYKGVYDIVIYTASNSKKYIADENPIEDFEKSVLNRMKAILDYKAGLQVHISSVDVYENLESPEKTKENHRIDITKNSNYGFHKYLEELIVQHYAENWLIFRLAGMVGKGLKKNPVYDILHNQPLRIHPDSKYQFLNTDEVAKIVWNVVKKGIVKEIFNVCGQGLITPKEIANIIKREIKYVSNYKNERPRIVNINTDKIKKNYYMPNTYDTIKRFLNESKT